MAKTVTFLELKTRARERADQVNSGFISNSELNSYINASCEELYDILVATYDDEYYEVDFPFTAITGQEKYDLPDDFYKLNGVDYLVTNTNRYSVKKFGKQERNYLRGSSESYSRVGAEIYYRLKANQIEFLPAPSGARKMNLLYIPVFEKMTVDSDDFDGINGWEEYVIIDSAIKMAGKQEDDIRHLVLQKQAITMRIEKMKSNRDTSYSAGIQDTRSKRWGRSFIW